MDERIFDVGGMILKLVVDASEREMSYTLFDITNPKYPMRESIVYAEKLDGFYPLYHPESSLGCNEVKAFGIAISKEEARIRLEEKIEEIVCRLRKSRKKPLISSSYDTFDGVMRRYFGMNE